MKKRIALAAGGLAVALAAAIPASGAFGCVSLTSPHCQKLNNSLTTAGNIIGNTNSGQSSNVQNYLNNAAGKCD